jgi:hypothetical protein
MSDNAERPTWVEEHTDEHLGEPIFRTVFPQGPRTRTYDMYGYQDPRNGSLRFIIEGLDPTNFEAVVGPEKAQEYRDWVDTRRGNSVPTTLRPTLASRILDRIGIIRKP